MVVSLVSFGFKHGIPYGTDLLFDVRFLPNPHFVPGLREQTGQDAGVQRLPGAAAGLPGAGRSAGRPSGLPAAALPPGEPELPLGGDRLHGWKAPVGGHLRAAEAGAGRPRLAARGSSTATSPADR